MNTHMPMLITTELVPTPTPAPVPFLTLTRGLPGAGKSTYAQRWLSQDSVNRVLVNRDVLRLALTGEGHPRRGYADRWNDADEQYITGVEREAVRRHLAAGKQVLVDDCLLKDRYVRDWLGLAAVSHVGTAIVDLRTADPLTCVNRDWYRATQGGAHVGRDLILELHQRFIAGKDLDEPLAAVYDPESYNYQPYVANADLPPAYLFDMDGTLARNPMFGYEQGEGDSPIEGVVTVLRYLANTSEDPMGTQPERPQIVIVTARRSDRRVHTAKWLSNNAVEYDAMFCRPDGDNRPDPIIKYEILRDELTHRYNVLGVFEDRPRVCRMYRAVGLQVFQVGDPDNDS